MIFPDVPSSEEKVFGFHRIISSNTGVRWIPEKLSIWRVFQPYTCASFLSWKNIITPGKSKVLIAMQRRCEVTCGTLPYHYIFQESQNYCRRMLHNVGGVGFNAYGAAWKVWKCIAQGLELDDSASCLSWKFSTYVYEIECKFNQNQVMICWNW